MKLNQIINESTDPKRPTDLTKYPLKPGNKYTANFYTGKKGVKNGKIVLGYNDIKNKNDFRTTDPVASINQSKSTPLASSPVAEGRSHLQPVFQSWGDT